MSEHNENSFQPHSDDELARLLEEQMKQMRAQTPTPPPTPPSVVEATPAQNPDDGIDSLFGALLDDSIEEPAKPATEPVTIPNDFDEENLDHTQPLVIQEEVIVVEAAHEMESPSVVSEDEILIADLLREAVVEDDPHSVAERVLSDISEEGIVAATVLTPDPVPQMFSDSTLTQSPNVPSPGALAETSGDIPQSTPLYSTSQENQQTQRSRFRLKPVSSNSPRPSFDELVFGQKQED